MKQFQKQRGWTPKHWGLELSSRWRTSGRGPPERGCTTASAQLMGRTAWNGRWEGLCPLFQAFYGVLDCPCKSFHPLSLSFHCSTGSIYSSVASLLWMSLSDVQVLSPSESARLFLVLLCFNWNPGLFDLHVLYNAEQIFSFMQEVKGAWIVHFFIC